MKTGSPWFGRKDQIHPCLRIIYFMYSPAISHPYIGSKYLLKGRSLTAWFPPASYCGCNLPCSLSAVDRITFTITVECFSGSACIMVGLNVSVVCTELQPVQESPRAIAYVSFHYNHICQQKFVCPVQHLPSLLALLASVCMPVHIKLKKYIDGMYWSWFFFVIWKCSGSCFTHYSCELLYKLNRIS